MIQSEVSTVTVSVIIATRNRAQRLAETLGHLSRQHVPCSWEILVVDNASQDRTPEVLSEWQRSLPIIALYAPMAGKNRALNLALRHAKGSLLMFTDDDVVPESCWLSSLVAAAERWPDFDLFGGPILPAWPPSTPDWLREHAFASVGFAKFTPPLSKEGPLEHTSLFGPNFTVRRKAMVGLRFDERIGARSEKDQRYPLGDETELLVRLRERGSKTLFVPAAGVNHIVEPHQVLRQWLFRRSFRVGRTFALGRPDRLTPRILGVPRHLWRRIVEDGARYIFARKGLLLDSVDRGLRLHHTLGQIAEYRHPSIGPELSRSTS